MNRVCSVLTILGGMLLAHPVFCQEAKPLEGSLKVEKVAPPTGIELKAAQKEVRSSYATDFKTSKSLIDKHGLAKTLAQQARSVGGVSSYAFGMEAIDLFLACGDPIGAFGVIDDLSVEFDLPVVTTKATIFKKAIKEARTPAQKRTAALLGLKLASDAANSEQYDVAKDVATVIGPLAKASRDSAVVERVNSQANRFNDALKSWQSVEEAREALAKDANDAAANEVVGKYLCFIRQDWKTGLPFLNRAADPELKANATFELSESVASPAQQLAVAWWDYAERHKKERIQVLPRCAYWLEKLAPTLTGVAKADAEARLLECYKALSGRDFSKILSSPPNGVLSIGITDCSADMVGVGLKEGFAFEQSWLLSLQFYTESFPGGPHMVFSWADGRPGRDALMLGWNGENFGISIEDCVAGGGQSINFTTTKEYAGRWVDVKVVHDTLTGELELYIDNRLIRRDPLTITPRPDIGMPLYLGGSAGAGYRYPGLVRNVWFGNIK